MIIDELFEMIAAKSKSTDDYLAGNIPFVTNTQVNNGVVLYVEPFNGDRVFEGSDICISGLGYATVHLGRFLPKGNGGDSCTILSPKQEMSNSELLYYAALFNNLHGWRFSFGRKANKERLKRLSLEPLYTDAPINVEKIIMENNALMSKLLRDKEVEFQKL